MLEQRDAEATLAGMDIRPAKHFYEGVPGAKGIRADEMGLCGGSMVRIGELEYDSSSKATNVNWSVGDEIDGVLQALNSF